MKKIFALFLGAFLMSGCSWLAPFSSPANPTTQADYEVYEDNSGSSQIPGNTYNTTLISWVDKYTGTKVGGDCSGFITALNSKNKEIFFDSKELPKYFTNGRKSQAIYNYYKKRDLIAHKNPRVGDLIFFQNTLQSNKKRLNNEISHIGVIREIYADGRIKFVHNSRGRNKVDFVNLNKKNTHKNGKKIENSYIVRCGSNKVSCLASNRFAGYGRVKQ
ncbi:MULTISPECIES: NlpC/P60 family protein [unclassified Campylobacter]|uniref:NlpC/P60 family protein n=1 Tax=unclassified Campylobacter TaxID=2593542 RepID=UPI0022E997A5|nr:MULTISPECIES: NlpC/P60 family protein [unclassified Campylobacter]MDA3054052.1 C40 family peptidase [Campylobacter sp. VBCF_07 NA4]MDA3060061.1 C40 family peptidase [Campylobacter sp. VBCF_02 NA5]MDA3069575.1 C40 family peptidase [Campylobacter sp. VBCF_08 NA3]WBR53543.1 NlpC/P60 family protein [Campylobacter sp. VBCF_01 NA2]